MQTADGGDTEAESRRTMYFQRAQQLLAAQRRIQQGMCSPAHKELLSHLSRQDPRKICDNADARVCSIRDVLRLADHTSATLFAPQAWRPPPPLSSMEGAAAENWQWQPAGRLVGGFPPAPQPENMQKGRLGLYSEHFSHSAGAASAAPCRTASTQSSFGDGNEEGVGITGSHADTSEKQPSSSAGQSRQKKKRPRSPETDDGDDDDGSASRINSHDRDAVPITTGADEVAEFALQQQRTQQLQAAQPQEHLAQQQEQQQQQL